MIKLLLYLYNIAGVLFFIRKLSGRHMYYVWIKSNWYKRGVIEKGKKK